MDRCAGPFVHERGPRDARTVRQRFCDIANPYPQLLIDTIWLRLELRLGVDLRATTRTGVIQRFNLLIMRRKPEPTGAPK